MLYELYGLVVASDDPLPGLPCVAGANVDIRVRCTTPLLRSPSPSDWFMKRYLPNGKLWLSLARMNGDYLLRFNELADFFIGGGGREIAYLSKPGTPQETINHLLLDQVIPLVINLKGFEALHVSAILTSRGVVAFAGLTGWGKSTLAGSFLSKGYPLLSDDCLVLLEKGDHIYAVPAYPRLRLWGDALSCLLTKDGSRKPVAHYTQKCRVDIENNIFSTKPQPLKRIYMIADPSEAKGRFDIKIERLFPQESFMTLVQCAFRLDITDRNMLIRQFHFLKRVASTVSVRRLIFPRDFNLLPAVREAIINDLNDLDN